MNLSEGLVPCQLGTNCTQHGTHVSCTVMYVLYIKSKLLTSYTKVVVVVVAIDYIGNYRQENLWLLFMDLLPSVFTSEGFQDT